MKFDTSKFLVGAYYYTNNLYNDAHMKELADMGVDFLVAVDADAELMELCEKYNIGAIAYTTIPLWWGGEGDKAGQYSTEFPLSKLDEHKATYKNYKMLWGDYPVDEPSSKDFTHINKVIKKYKETFPGQFPYINLYPNYASVPSNNDEQTVSQLGNETYDEHILQYVQEVETDYICFDFYPYSGASPFSTYIENLDTVSRACRDSGREMWVIIQTGAWKAEEILDEFQIRWQAYLCLAYGTTLLMHASYCVGWWDENTSCVNTAGEKNITYYYAKEVNKELHALGDVFLQYQHIGAYACGKIAEAEARIQPQLALQNARNGSFDGIKEVTVEADGAVLTGCFNKKDGNGSAVMLVNTQDPFNKDTTINATLKFAEGARVAAYVKGIKQALPLDEQGCAAIKLQSGEGVFVTID